ncbi:hypothetical protein NKI72_31305 [Mesorhizobium sp. M0437]|uniref:hypothetical protein n=1 Tax=Mesorhizobium sp. M0437 TaxID=2956945 RepID=UPI0033396B74
MNKIAAPIIAAYWVAMAATSAYADTVSVEFTDEVIRNLYVETLRSVNGSWNVNATLDLQQDGTIISRPDGQIEMGKETLVDSLKSVEPNYRPLALRFILLHELWHQVQFRDQGSDVNEEALGLNRFLECQADLMASRFLGSAFVEAFAKDPDAIEKFYGGLFDLGDFEEGGSSHPSIEHRKLAITRGLMRLLFESGALFQGQETSKAAFAAIAGIRNGEADLQWSVRQCQLITQMDDAAVAAVTRGTPQLNWNTNANGSVTYRIPYTNTGSVPLRVELEIIMAQVPRDDRHDLGKRRLLFGADYLFDIASGGTYTVTGKLPWVASDVMMPQIVFPPDPGSLMRAEFLNENTNLSATTTTATEISPDEIVLKEALLALSSNAKFEFSNFRQGAARYRGDELAYRSSLALPGAESTTIILHRKGEVDVRAQFSEKDKNRVRLTYEKYDLMLRHMFPNKLVKKDAHRSKYSKSDYNSSRVQVSRYCELEILSYVSSEDDDASFSIELSAVKF